MLVEENEVKLCKYLLEKCADIINEREKRTIGEIKSLVDGTDLSVQSFVEDFKDSAYSFDADYENSLKQVFDFTKKEIGSAQNNWNIN